MDNSKFDGLRDHVIDLPHQDIGLVDHMSKEG